MARITSADIDRTVKGQTVGSNFLATVATHGDRAALCWRDASDEWQHWTFGDYAERVARVAAGLTELGLGAGDRMVLMMRNSPEFHVIDMAAVMCGATPISIYNSSSVDQIRYLAGDCEATVAVVEDDGFGNRFAPVRDDLGHLKALAVVRPGEANTMPTFDELCGSDPIDLERGASRSRPEDLATIIYTSGTTGPPKGVTLTHHNIAWTVECLKLSLEFDTFAGKRLVSYLPMAHIAERMTSHYQQATLGYEVTSCPDPGEIATFAREVRPNIMFGVPRVWEKLHAGVTGAMAADPDKAAKFDRAVETARPIALRKAWGTATDEEIATWDSLDENAFAGVRVMLGLDCLDAAITGAAPIPAELLGWYHAIGVPISEIYGLSESCGPMTWTPYAIKPGTVGPAIPGCEVILAEDGEVLCRGGNVFAGYLGMPERTAETIDEDGWLHSGDIGEMDDDGYVRIIDRKKELIITAGGKNLSPANLEAALKMVPLVGQACVIGDNRPFVSALVVLDPDTAPAWARQQGIGTESIAELAEHPSVVAQVESGVEEAMAEFNNAERVKKIKILPNDWQPDSAELTPTSKLKRRGIHEKYADEIEALYA